MFARFPHYFIGFLSMICRFFPVAGTCTPFEFIESKSGGFMSRVCCSVVLLASLLFSFASAGEAKNVTGEDLLPESTIAALVIPDISKSREIWKTTRIAEMFAQPEMQEFLTPVFDQFQKSYRALQTQYPILPSWPDLDKGLLSGEVTLGFFLHNNPQPQCALLTIRPADPAAFLNAMKPLFRDQALQENTIVPFGNGPDAAAALWTGERFLLCKPQMLLNDLSQRIKNGPAGAKDTLAANADYQAAKQKMKDSAGWIYVRPAGAAELAKALVPAPESRIEQSVRGLGIQKNTSVVLALGVNAGELCGQLTVSNLDQGKGLGTILGALRPIPATSLKIAAPDAPFVSAGSWNPGAIIPMIHSILSDEEAASFEEALGQINQRCNFNLQKDLLENLTGEAVSAVTPIDTGAPLSMSPGMVTSFGMKNPAKMDECLRKLAAVVNTLPSPTGLKMQVKPVPHGAHTIQYFSGVTGLSFCIVGDRLLMASSVNAMRRSLDQLAKNDDITANKEFQETLARLSGRPFDVKNLPAGFSYSRDESTGSGALLTTTLGITSVTAAMAGLAEMSNPVPIVQRATADPMSEILGMLQRPSGQVALAVINSVDLGFWPDEGFFAKYRRTKGAVTAFDANVLILRTELPPPIPGMKSGGSILPMVAVTSIAAGLVLPVLARARESARRVSSASNMNQLAKACYMFADVPANGDFPDDPRKLFPKFVADPRVFSNPRFADQAVGFIYVSGISLTDDEGLLLLYENVPAQYAAQGRNVLTVNGMVQFASNEAFQQLLKKTEEAIKKREGKMTLLPLDTSRLAPPKK
jgi:hypothetical protein